MTAPWGRIATVWILILTAAAFADDADQGDAPIATEAPTTLAADPPAQETSSDELTVTWAPGVRLAPKSEAFFVKFGGAFMADIGSIGGDALGDDLGVPFNDGGRWRRLRPKVKGGIGETIRFKLGIEMADSGTRLTDGFVHLTDLPVVGNIYIGQCDEPFGLEQIMSSRDTTFLERGLPNALPPPRSWGVAAGNVVLDKRMTWAAGIFRTSTDSFSGNSDAGRPCSLTGRVTALPWYRNDGADLLHLGVDYSYRRPSEPIRYSSTPEAFFAPVFTDTGMIDADRVNLFAAELAWVRGPMSIQSEFMASVVDTPDLSTLCFSALYVQASCFLTGEHRPYDTSTGVFTRLRPKKNFPTNGWGAVEIAARYSYLDLDKAGLPHAARDLHNGSVGINWYWSPTMRLMLNYIRTCVDGSDTADAADIVVARLQLTF